MSYTPTSSIAQPSLPADVPHLENGGANWAIFHHRFYNFMFMTQRWGHIDGSHKRPTPVDASKPTKEEKLEASKWDYEDVVASYLIGQRLGDNISMQIIRLPTAKEKWDAVSRIFTAKSEYAKNDLYQSFIDMKCERAADVREYLDNLKTRRCQLEAIGVHITDRDHERTVLRGIPDHLATFASQFLAALHLNSETTGDPIDTEKLHSHIADEADRVKTRRALKDQAQHKGKKADQTDQALAVTNTPDGGNNNSNNFRGKRRKGKCNHCGREGHWIRECRTKKKEEAAAANNQSGQTAQASSGSSSRPENKPVGSANIVTAFDSDPEGFYTVVEDNEHFERPDNEGERPYIEEIVAAAIAPSDEDHSPRIEIFDTGATRHISPYKADFSSYTTLSPPVYLKSADKNNSFPAIGMGTLIVKTSINGRESKLTLQNALHAPAVGFTLVSLGTLDEEGYRYFVENGHLHLLTPRRDLVAIIPRNAQRLYKAVHAYESAHTVQPMSAMELHRRLGHISVASARKLVENGAIKGIKLDPNAPDTDCDACILARATRLPVPKPRISVPAQNFGDIIHTDVWGPAPVRPSQLVPESGTSLPSRMTPPAIQSSI
jgi:gag-polypeptide of LTR copia-type/Pol polyprotein, beta-barrel domain/GAG-pre-integrase domain